MKPVFETGKELYVYKHEHSRKHSPFIENPQLDCETQKKSFLSLEILGRIRKIVL